MVYKAIKLQAELKDMKETGSFSPQQGIWMVKAFRGGKELCIGYPHSLIIEQH